MGKFVKGDVLVMPFPFSDLSQTKKRPVFVLSAPGGNDLILCQITSKNTKDGHSVKLEERHFKIGTLSQESNARPNKIFTADSGIIQYKIGKLTEEKAGEIIEKTCQIIKS